MPDSIFQTIALKIISYPNASKALWDADGNTLYYDGMTIGEIWGYETEGIAKSDEQMTEWLANNDQSKNRFSLGSRRHYVSRPER